MSICLVLIVLVTVIRALFQPIQCNSTKSSIISSTISNMVNDDYFWFNLSNNFIDQPELEVTFLTSPLTPIDVYYSNNSIYHSCAKECYLKSVSTRHNFVVRINKYLPSKKLFNYTLTVLCNSATTIPPLYDYSLSLSQRLTFRNRANIFGFAVTVFITILFVFIGTFYHSHSEKPELIFISNKTNWWFYICAILTLFLSILMTALYKTDKKYKTINETFLGILISLTMASINLASIINIKYYGSYLRSDKFLLISRVITICITLIMIMIYFINLFTKTYTLSNIVQILTISEAILLLFMSLISKTAQLQLCLLCMLIWWSFAANYNEIFFCFYWYSMICIVISLISIFVFSEKYTSELRSMFISLFGGFISLFDMNTDITIIILWISGGLYFWVIMQVVFILAGTFYSAFYIDDYYFITESTYTDSPYSIIQTHRKTKNIPRLFWGRMFAFFGLGRLYHTIVGWDETKNKDMEIANRALKLWEMVFESFPTITLQFWVSLYTDFDINIVLSLCVSFASVSFTFFRILYSDHYSDKREEEIIIGQRVHEKHRTSNMKKDYDKNYMMNARTHNNNNNNVHIITDINNTIEKEPTNVYITDDENYCCSNLYQILSNKSKIIENFICCFPFKLIYDYMEQKNEIYVENCDKSWGEKLKDYFILYVWIISDFFCRIFPILVYARIQNDYLQFIAIMTGLTIYEFFFYYFMLKDDFKHPRSASHWFWTLYTSVSFCLLSTMYLIYLPCNVQFNRLIYEHLFRMIIQLIFMIIAMYLQNLYFGSWFAFFDTSIKFFFCVISMNIIMTIYIARKYNQINPQMVNINKSKTNLSEMMDTMRNISNVNMTPDQKKDQQILTENSSNKANEKHIKQENILNEKNEVRIENIKQELESQISLSL